MGSIRTAQRIISTGKIEMRLIFFFFFGRLFRRVICNPRGVRVRNKTNVIFSAPGRRIEKKNRFLSLKICYRSDDRSFRSINNLALCNTGARLHISRDDCKIFARVRIFRGKKKKICRIFVILSFLNFVHNRHAFG